MDRTAWIAVILCVLGLFAWQIWTSRQTVPRPAVATTPSPAVPGVTASPTPSVATTVAPQPAGAATTVPSATPLPFMERTETLRNSDVELHFTNRGGGIAEAILPNYLAEHGESVTLNSPARLPIGAIIDDPAAPFLPEYTIAHEENTMTLEYVAPEQVTIRKKFSFAKTNEKKENFIATLDVDFVNGGAQPYANPGYFFAVGSAVPIHANDYPSYTR